MLPQMPKISVLMPIYKTNLSFLREAIESVINQTYQDFEFLILNDSPDHIGLDEVVAGFSDNRIKYFKNEKNLGITPSRNKLLDLAKGEYVAILDHDDVCLPTRFEEEVKVLDEQPEIGVVGSLYERFPKGGVRVSKMDEYNEAIERHLIQGCGVLHPSAMVRRSVLRNNNIKYEEEFTPAEDYALWCRLIGKTKFYNIQKVLMKYRWHNTNTSKLQGDKRSLAIKRMHAFLKKDCPELWNEVHKSATYIIRGRLFGIIPILRMKIKGDNPPNWLKYCPFLKITVRLAR